MIQASIGGGWRRSEQFFNGSDYIHCLAAPADANGLEDAAVFIDISQKFEPSALHELIKQNVNRPNVMGVLDSQQRFGAV